MRAILVILSICILSSCQDLGTEAKTSYVFIILNAPDQTLTIMTLDGDTIVQGRRRYEPSWSVSYAEAFHLYEGRHTIVCKFPERNLSDTYSFEARDTCTVGIHVDSTVTFWFMKGIFGLE